MKTAAMLLRPLLSGIVLLFCANAALSGQSVLPPESKSAMITVARNGAVSVNERRVRLDELIPALNAAGVTDHSHIAVEGAGGTPYKYIERVMVRLVEGGFLPGDVIP